MLLLVLLVIGFGVTYWTPGLRHGGPATGGFEALSGPTPVATLSAAATALGGADFDMLDAPGDQRIARDLDFYSWYAAGAGAANLQSATPSVLPESSTPETSAPDADVQDCADGEAAACASTAEDGNAR
jgi:hypothetical protein